VSAIGSPPDASPEELRRLMDSSGLSDADLVVVLSAGGGRICPAGQTTCSPLAS